MSYSVAVEVEVNMQRIILVCVLVAVCAVCESATVPGTPVGLKNLQRFGTYNKYYLASWTNLESGSDLMVQVANTDAGVEALTLDGSENVAVVVHGRSGRANSEFGITLRDSLIQQGIDVILVDWEFVAAFDYSQAAALVPLVALDVSDFLTRLVTANKLDVNQLHLIGFDLGAHAVGIAGRNLATRARKITGLDPAGEGWDSWSDRLRSSDAQFVEVIHTDGIGTRAFGIGEAIGTLDIFPNGGTRQPGCSASNNECHHNRAWQLFAATVDSGGHLIAFKCDTMALMTSNRCTGLPTAIVGGATQLVKLASGIYRVNTGNSYPYAA